MKKILLFIAFAMVANWSMGQDEALNKYKSLFTLNFIRYISWPESETQGDFVIGVVKNRELAELLTTQTKGKKFGYQTIVVKEYNSIDDVENCHILYASKYSNFKKNSAKLIEKVKGTGTLIVTESENATTSGSMINFVVRDNKLKFEVCEKNAKLFGITFSSSLGSLSNAIKI